LTKSDRIFALTHHYTAYPLVRRVRGMAQGDVLGETNCQTPDQMRMANGYCGYWELADRI
jgi:hypothetical protein